MRVVLAANGKSGTEDDPSQVRDALLKRIAELSNKPASPSDTGSSTNACEPVKSKTTLPPPSSGVSSTSNDSKGGVATNTSSTSTGERGTDDGGSPSDKQRTHDNYTAGAPPIQKNGETHDNSSSTSSLSPRSDATISSKERNDFEQIELELESKGLQCSRSPNRARASGQSVLTRLSTSGDEHKGKPGDTMRSNAKARRKRVRTLHSCERPECGKSETSAKEFKMCGGCRARYCSPECSALHWKLHKKMCKKVKKNTESR